MEARDQNNGSIFYQDKIYRYQFESFGNNILNITINGEIQKI